MWSSSLSSHQQWLIFFANLIVGKKYGVNLHIFDEMWDWALSHSIGHFHFLFCEFHAVPEYSGIQLVIACSFAFLLTGLWASWRNSVLLAILSSWLHRDQASVFCGMNTCFNGWGCSFMLLHSCWPESRFIRGNSAQPLLPPSPPYLLSCIGPLP